MTQRSLKGHMLRPGGQRCDMRFLMVLSVFRDMTATGEGEHRGRARGPAHDREYSARMALDGRQLIVSGCVGPFCQSQVWARSE